MKTQRTAPATTPTPQHKNFTRNHPLPPIKLYQHIFCQHCDLQCNPTEARFQNCILTLIADELTRTRQLLQQHTQQQVW